MDNPKKFEGMSWLNMGCFPHDVLFAFNMDYKEITQMLKEKESLDYLAGLKKDKQLIKDGKYFALSRPVKSDTGEIFELYYIIIKEFNFTDDDYCILAHEVLHITNFYLQKVLDRNKEFEAEAYFHSHLMRQCLNVLRGNTN